MADEPAPASMTQDDVLAPHTRRSGGLAMPNGRMSFRHIACNPSVDTGDAMLAPINPMEDTPPQFAHVCKGGTTERAGP